MGLLPTVAVPIYGIHYFLQMKKGSGKVTRMGNDAETTSIDHMGLSHGSVVKSVVEFVLLCFCNGGFGNRFVGNKGLRQWFCLIFFNQLSHALRRKINTFWKIKLIKCLDDIYRRGEFSVTVDERLGGCV